ncbi:(Fe-S)-binding protein [Pendulispora albinea]|uniref:(Fe-S)-binding protein n=1 Tax=Pendulispora albinea TaxID=2741071 RepID=A0ABZ2LX19_9BACT
MKRRPDSRPMKALPILETKRTALENCVFCPKLCRSACPVSNAEPRETLTPWGKMSMAYFAAHGDVPAETSYARTAWACTGCYGCRELCDHRNDVTSALYLARSAWQARGTAPEQAARTLAQQGGREAETRAAIARLAEDAGARSDARVGLLVGCTYSRKAPDVAREAVEVAKALAGEDVALIDACCGLPLLMAGDAPGFERRAVAMAERLRGFERVAVVDAGCAAALRLHYRAVHVELEKPVSLLVEWAAREAARFARLDARSGREVREAVRWHDPCQLGRGLGIYEAPRTVLTRILGEAPAEFDARRERATCAGGGGLLPVTMPEQARTIAEARLEEHARAGGGRVVTGCASSLHALRRASGAGHARASAVEDIVTWMARSLRAARTGPAA